ncbi:MAG: Gfo/Idh/MocA family oxidoreductase [Kiritimatiellae bacterium]|nr:Gfo/Idh/MocA family oxidoreductase [Kiritimatiellia bacterium]
MIKQTLFAATIVASAALFGATNEKRIGIIGLDTSHSTKFADIVNVQKPDSCAGFKVTSAYKWGSKDIFSSTNRYPKYIEHMNKLGVKIYEDLDEMIASVDFILLETNDGREHLWQAEKVFKAGKPCYIDKPLAASFADAAKIVELGRKYNAKWFTTSGLRYGETMRNARAGKYGKIIGAAMCSPSHFALNNTHSEYYWYAIHGFEPLLTIMGTGVEKVRTIRNEGVDIVTGVWKDGRIGTLRALTAGGLYIYGGYIIPENPWEGSAFIPISTNPGYGPLVGEIIEFFKTGKAPVSDEETLELFRFMEAASISAREGGREVKLSEVK